MNKLLTCLLVTVMVSGLPLQIHLATAQTQSTITFYQSGVGGDFTGTVATISGTEYGQSDFATGPGVDVLVDDGQTVNFEFKSPLLAPPGKQYVWSGTTGLSTKQNDTITVTDSGNVTGSYKTQYQLTVTTDPSNITTIPGTDWYNLTNPVTEVSLVAPLGPFVGPDNSNYVFLYWDLDGVSLGNGVNSITVTMDDQHSATAHYVTLRSTSTSVSPDPSCVIIGNTITYTATVTDTDASGTASTPTGTVGWSDDGAGGSFSSSSCQLDQSGSCTVTYTPPPTPKSFEITATYGGDAIHIASSGTSKLIVQTQQQGIQSLQKQVQELKTQGKLNRGQTNSLMVKLNHALTNLKPGKSKVACNQLNAFINQVNDYVSTGVLTPDVGAVLTSQAQAIISAIKSSGGPAFNVQAARDAIQSLKGQVQKLGLKSGQTRSLIVKLDNALLKLNSEKPAVAGNQLKAFINQVNAYVSARIIKDPAVGKELVSQAQAIINAISA